jgi:GDSL-like Lipase/Acylhydrolase
MRNLTLFTFCVALFLLRASYGHQRLVVFGDSLSDNGNTFAVAEVPGISYFQGRYSNGPNWVDYFPGIASHFNVDISLPTPWLKDPTNSDDNATDFAVGGSTSGDLNVLNGAFPKFPDQIMAYQARLGSNNAADDLCVIWIAQMISLQESNLQRRSRTLKEQSKIFRRLAQKTLLSLPFQT